MDRLIADGSVGAQREPLGHSCDCSAKGWQETVAIGALFSLKLVDAFVSRTVQKVSTVKHTSGAYLLE